MLDAFYDEVYPTSGFTVVATLGENGPVHRVTDNVQKLAQELGDAQENTFISLGSYDLEQVEHVEKENEVTHLKGLCPRISSFVFDLDVEVDNPKKYGSLQEAVEALQSAMADEVMPMPRWVVFSGGGLHFYYVLGHAISEEQWSPICRGLRNAFTQAGLRIDRAVGTYPYRLIRAPGTYNQKFSPAKPVKISGIQGPLSTVEQLQSYCAEEPVKKPTQTADPIQERELVPFEQLLHACPSLKHVHDVGGRDVSENEWWATANIVAFTTGGAEKFHELSKDHAGYDAQECQALYERVSAGYIDGPSRCEAFFREQCLECPYHKLGSSPIQAAREAKPVEPEVLTSFETPYVDVAPYADEESMTLPEGFSREGNMLMFFNEPVSSWFEVGRAQFNSVTQSSVCTLTRHNKEKCVFQLKALGRMASTASELANLGIRVLKEDAANMYIKDISLQYAPLSEDIALGWDEDLKNFVSPTGRYPEGTDLMPSISLRKLTDDWRGCQGDAKLWVKALKMLGYEGQEPMLMCVLASMASPLLRYLNLEKGVIYSMAGDKGMGKSTAMRIANSVWGEPIGSTVQANDTYKSMRKKIAMSGNLPMTIDETTMVTPTDMQHLAFEISQGAGRSRLQQSGDLAEEEVWQLIAISNSNNSIHRKLLESPVGDGADLTRVFEVMIDKKQIHKASNVSADEGQVMSDKIDENYGHFGQLLVDWLFKEDRQDLVMRARAMRKELKRKFALDGSSRFHESLIVACYVAHIAAKEIDQDFPGSPDVMYSWMQAQLVDNTEAITDMLDIRMPTVDNFLVEYEQDGNIKRSLDAEGTFDVFGTSFKGFLYQFDDCVYVPVDLFKAWCLRQNVTSADVIKRWSEGGYLLPVKNVDGRNPKYTGRSPKPIKINNETLYPTVLIVQRNVIAQNAEITQRIQS